MAATSGPGNPALKQALEPSEVEARLRKEPYAFGFFQAVRMLERLFPERKRVGGFVHPAEEVVHFGAHSSLAFPASEIQSLDAKGAEPARMSVNFMGLTGPLGALPQWYTGLVAERLRANDKGLRDFLDIFNHRFVSLFYQAWEKYRFAIAYERGELDRFSHILLDLIGMGTVGLQDRQAVPDEAFLFFSGMLAQRPRSAKALESIVAEYFQVPVEVQQLLGGWFRLDPATECCLGDRESASEQLGQGAVTGNEVWDQQARARIKLGPLSMSQYLEFLPNGSAFEPLRALTRFFANDEIDFEVQLVLHRSEVPACELGSVGDDSPKLGWVSWVRSGPVGRDPEDTILSL
ncbi:MAG TPA: type VI secretion system baseplate subunit TssG [Candidatus Acidoferrum sp.]|nr:type VI secretion system baseplate subunit TssG [Candidatus Acidoferrum sp.]